MIDYYTDFVKARELELKKMIQEFEVEIDKARAKGVIYSEKKGLTGQKRNDLYDNLGSYGGFFFEIQDEFGRDRHKQLPEIFNLKLDNIPHDDVLRIMPDLVSLHAIEEFFFTYLNLREKELFPVSLDNSVNKTSLKWLGEKTEFIQLIYALHRANYLEGKITKIVPEFAKLLNLEIGDGWQQNHNSSVNKRKNGYFPNIFNKLSKAYETYKDEINSKNKKS